ncbi:MAG: PDZ domain-containing protein, partial [bacterium]
MQDAQPEPYAGFEVEAPNNQRKIYVSQVEERGKAHGKLKRGDLLISINRKSITSVEQFREMMAKSKVGDKLVVKVKRRTPDGSRVPFETVTVEFEVFVDTRIKP